MKTILTISWFQDVPEQHKNELEEHALERAIGMRKEGYIGGELHYEIEKDETIEAYSGWWEYKEIIE